MAGWTVPVRTWADGDEPTGAMFNEEIRDRMNALITSCQLFYTGGGTFPVAATTVVTFDTAGSDPLGMWSPTDTTRIVIPIAGKYRIRARAGGSTSNGVSAELIVYKNGASWFTGPLSPTGLEIPEVEAALAANDYLQLYLSTPVGGSYPTSPFVSNIDVDFAVEWKAP